MYFVRLSDEVRALDLEKQEKLPGFEYWLEPFDTSGEKKWIEVLSVLQYQLKNEFNGTIPTYVGELLCALNSMIPSEAFHETFSVHDAQVVCEAEKAFVTIVAKAYSYSFSEATENAS